MSNKLFKVATFNCASIRARLSQILSWLMRTGVDVLGLQETKVEDSAFPADPFREAGYCLAFHGEKGRAGVALISRYELKDVAWGLDDGGPPDGSRLIRAIVHHIPIINVYAPQGEAVDSPEFEYKLRWIARMKDFFQRHYHPNEPLIWMGDFNVALEPIDVYDPSAFGNHPDFHPLVRAGYEDIRKWGFVDIFRKHHPNEPGQYTFWDYRIRNTVQRNLGWRIDHIWATMPLAEKSVAAWIDVEARRAERPSDHTFLVAEFDLE